MRARDIKVGGEYLLKVRHPALKGRWPSCWTAKRVTVLEVGVKPGTVTIEVTVQKPTNLKRFSEAARSQAIIEGRIKYKAVVERREVATRDIITVAPARADGASKPAVGREQAA